MKIMLATDAWYPQVNGVVRTLATLRHELKALGHDLVVVAPERFATLPMPGYPEIRMALISSYGMESVVDEIRPDAIHVPVEGPIGFATRKLCMKRGLPFSSSYHTRAGLYFEQKLGIPSAWVLSVQRHFHSTSSSFMVQTDSLERELSAAGFTNIRRWSRGVDTNLFRPFEGDTLFAGLERPVWVNVGRISREKRVEDFLALDLPGTKVVVGDGPQAAEYRARYPKVRFVGVKTGDELARHYAAADVFVFPSRFETFGLVALEALACSTPVAAYPVHGPLDVIGDDPVGVLSEDLRSAALRALEIDRTLCRAFALRFSWRSSTEEFLSNLVPIRAGSERAAA